MKPRFGAVVPGAVAFAVAAGPAATPASGVDVQADENRANVNAPVTVLSPNSNQGQVEQSGGGSGGGYQANVNAPVAIGSENSNNGDVTQRNAASTPQSGTGLSTGVQSNTNAPMSVGSTGANNGNVTQDNGARTAATADDPGSAATATANQTNSNTPIAFDSTSTNDGNVSQRNAAGTSADASSASTQSPGIGAQSAVARADSSQSNTNNPFTIAATNSNNGDVAQDNAARTSAQTTNANAVSQAAGLDQPGSNRSQADQSADAGATNAQANLNAPTASVADDTNNGPVRQHSDAITGARAGNANRSAQSNGPAGPLGQTRAAGNDNAASQSASANALNRQDNANAPIADLTSHNANNGSVDQANTARTSADARNANGTLQGNDQRQGGLAVAGPHSQTATNENATTQDADANASAQQSNIRAPNAVFNGQDSGNGDSRQRNAAGTYATAENRNQAAQVNRQGQVAGIADPSQSAGNRNATHQHADATAPTYQSNSNVPFHYDAANVNDGDVRQGNEGVNRASAVNDNRAAQSNGQAQAGAPLDQAQTTQNDNRTDQLASSSGELRQDNTNWPNGPAGTLRDSNSNNGDVAQGNRAAVVGATRNQNDTRQASGQTQTAPGGAGAQSQSATNRTASDQAGSAAARADQSNTRMPSGFGKADSNNGDVSQRNDASAFAGSVGSDRTSQGIGQQQDGGPGVGAQEQRATNDNQTRQEAPVAASTTQQNVDAPVADGSRNANNGAVRQGNGVGAYAVGRNANSTSQPIDQQGAAPPQDARNANQTSQSAPAEAAVPQTNQHAPVAGPTDDGVNNGDVAQQRAQTVVATKTNAKRTP